MSKYDGRTTTFSPEGRLYQVEYAIQAIAQAGTAIGLVTKNGVVLATEKRTSNPLLDTDNSKFRDISGDKVYKIDEHVAVAVAGINSDASILLADARLAAQRHRKQFHEPIAAEQLVQRVCDIKQTFTQSGGQRPFGVSFLFAAWDNIHGLQLYHSDPSGNYSAWKAFAIGQDESTAQGLLKTDWNTDLDLDAGALLAVKILSKTMATNIKSDKIEIAVLSKSPGTAPNFHIYTEKELQPLIDEAARLKQKEEEEKEAKAKQAF